MKSCYSLLLTLTFLVPILAAQEHLTIAEQSGFTETSTYAEGISFYTTLANSSSQMIMIEKGQTDAGLPLHLVLISKDEDFDILSNRENGKAILLINNAIHPGEPDGIEASQMLARNLLADKKLNKLLDNVLVAIIPFYNIGGTLNRNTGSRANQNGPDEKGFRGNARNYDLNRDFIKNDTENSRSFSKIFHELDPEILIDTHVSNGADYQYVLTMVTPQADKLGEPLKGYLDKHMMPAIYKQMAKTPYEMTPYVNVWGSTPDKGWSQFFDSPRYSSGYAALFQTIGFESETHMLKSFEQRVDATYTFLLETLKFLDKHGPDLIQVRAAAREINMIKKVYPIAWELDKSDSIMIEHKGYRATYPKSDISGLPRLKYDRNQPYTAMVPYYNKFKASVSVTKPDYYLVPREWIPVIEALARNNVKMEILKYDTTILVEAYTITDYSARSKPYEGHYFHDMVKVEKTSRTMSFEKGDVLIPVNQKSIRYIIETLEPQATDSFFRWNFFDTILQMKEGFSSYVFEDEAIEILNNNPDLKRRLEEKKASEKGFRESSHAQLQFIFMASEHREDSFMEYPVYRIIR